MELIAVQPLFRTKCIVTLKQEGNYRYRLTSSIDNLIDYDINLQAGEEEAIKTFRVLQDKYFGRIVCEETFNDI